MSDETPTPNKIAYGYSKAEGRDTEESEEEGPGQEDDMYDAAPNMDTGIAKVMATRLSWSRALAMHDVSAGDAPGLAAKHVGDATGLAAKHVIVRGTFLARLRPVQRQTGPAVTHVLSDLTTVPEQDLIHRILRDTHTHWVDSTDLHPSNLVAMRGIARSSPSWNTSHLRCSVHRSRKQS
jgi:hypothetical protein